jgi:hypothetical protein
MQYVNLKTKKSNPMKTKRTSARSITIKQVLASVLVLVLISCGTDSMEKQAVMDIAVTEEQESEKASNEMEAAAIMANVLSAAPVIKTPEKIIKTAKISIRVEDYAKSRAEIEQMVKRSLGYIGQENEQNSSYSVSNNLEIRVPSAGFDSLVTRLVTVAREVSSKTVTTQDVTAQFVDIQARLKTKKEIERRYIELLSKATKISDILEIEEKIRVIREEIEAKEGELRYMSDQVSYSTIHLHFFQTFEYLPSERPGFFNRLASAFGSGWKGLLEFIIGFVNAWPVWLILSLLGWGTYRLIKRLTRPSTKNQSITN